jgi:hypothetical protein
MQQRERPRRVVVIVAALLVLWPVVLIATVRPEPGILATAFLFSMLAIVVASVRGLRIVVSIAAGMYATLCAALCLYRWEVGDWVDLGLTLALPDDSFHTVVLLLGRALTSAIIVLLIVHALLYAYALARLARRVHVPWWTALAAVAFFLIPAPHEKLLVVPPGADLTAGIPPLAPKTRYDVTGATEPVFLVQLESLNGIAANGEYDAGDPRHRGANEVMRRLARNGVYMPHIWSHDIQTHRASEGFLCGTVRNLSPGRAIDDIDAPCIADAFRKGGYRTVFLSSWFTPEFASKGKLMKQMGYDDIRFADELMQPDDEQALWGYDEAAFFRRAFEYLRKHYKPTDRLFVHLAVCAHHVGFSRDREHDRKWFSLPRPRQIEVYLDSARKQDASLQTFWNLYERYNGATAHVFIFGDHSFPLGLYTSMLPHLGATIDNYVTPMAYLPPKSRAQEFAAGTTIDALHGQSDMPPTLVELVTRKPQGNSLVPFLLRTRPAKFDYEQCHIMTQPFGLPGLLTTHGDEAYHYIFNRQCVDTSKITYGPLRQHRVSRECGVAFEEYERRYNCARYR